MWRTITLVAIALIAPAALHAQTGAAKGHASERAAVAAARLTFREVEDAVRTKALVRRDTAFTCEDELETRVIVDRDRRGMIRRLEWQGGSDDHGESNMYYYDAGGLLRFGFTERGAVNGTSYEERVYFAPDGAVARRIKRRLHGPGYLFADLEAIPNAETWLRDLCKREPTR
jgi:hypothetical protein